MRRFGFDVYPCIIKALSLFVLVWHFGLTGEAFAADESERAFFPTKAAVDAIWPLAEATAKSLPGGDVNLSTGQGGITLSFQNDHGPGPTLRLLPPGENCPMQEWGRSHVFVICGEHRPEMAFAPFVHQLERLALAKDSAWEVRLVPVATPGAPSNVDSSWPYDFITSLLGFVFFLLLGVVLTVRYARLEPKQLVVDIALFGLALLLRGLLTELEPGIYNIRLISPAQPAATCQAFNLHACGNEAWQYLVRLLGGAPLATLGVANLVASSLLVPLTRLAAVKLFRDPAAGLAAAVFVLCAPLLIRFGYGTEPVSLAVLLAVASLVAALSTLPEFFRSVLAALFLGLAYQIRLEMLLFAPWIGFLLWRNGKKGSRLLLLPGFLLFLDFVAPHLWILSGTWQADHADEWFVLGREDFSWLSLPALFVPAVSLEPKLIPTLSPLLLPVALALTAWKRPWTLVVILLLGATALLPYAPYGFNLSTSFGFLHYFPPYLWTLCLLYASASAILFARFPKGTPERKHIAWLFGLLLVFEVLTVPARSFLEERTVIHEELQFILEETPKLPDSCTLLLPPPSSTIGPLQPQASLFGEIGGEKLRFSEIETRATFPEGCVLAYKGAICSVRQPDSRSEAYCRFLERHEKDVLAEKIVPARPVIYEGYITEFIGLEFVSLGP